MGGEEEEEEEEERLALNPPTQSRHTAARSNRLVLLYLPITHPPTHLRTSLHPKMTELAEVDQGVRQGRESPFLLPLLGGLGGFFLFEFQEGGVALLTPIGGGWVGGWVGE